MRPGREPVWAPAAPVRYHPQPPPDRRRVTQPCSLRRGPMKSCPPWLGALALATVPAAAAAADPELRVFTVRVDGKPAGEFRMTIRAGADGSEEMTGAAAVRVRHLLGQYRYTFQGTEVWKDGRLLRLE